MTEPLLAIEDLRTEIQTSDGTVTAVDGLSVSIEQGETVCFVGESGSGKTLACDSIVGLVGPPADVSGSVKFDGKELLAASESELRNLRGNDLAYVFQNAQNALDPVYTIGDQIVEAVQFHEDIPAEDARERAVGLLRDVGLSRAGERIDQYPHELSDGMCQRVALAVGLAADPSLLIADELAAALDVVTQRRIIDRLKQLRDERNLAILLVTHNLRVVSALADRIVVLLDGQPVEYGPAATVLEQPSHPYTQALFRSFTADSDHDIATGAEFSETGCPFAPDCPHAVDSCHSERPRFEWVQDNERHQAACVYFGDDRESDTVLADARSIAIDDRFTDAQTAQTDSGQTDQPHHRSEIDD